MAALCVCGCSTSPDSIDTGDNVQTRTTGNVRIEYYAADESLIPQMDAAVGAAVENAESFEGAAFKREFTLHVYPTRGSLTAYWRLAWNDPGLMPQCWMIASSTPDLTALLSPREWTREQCGHDGADPSYVARIIAHETIHVLQGQNNPAPDINAVQETKWLNEGAAVLGSGQLDAALTQQVHALVAGGYEPASLAAAWTGPQGYGISGSIVQYIDTQWGRTVLRQLLAKTTNAAILSVLGVSEPELLRSWSVFAAR